MATYTLSSGCGLTLHLPYSSRSPGRFQQVLVNWHRIDRLIVLHFFIGICVGAVLPSWNASMDRCGLLRASSSYILSGKLSSVECTRHICELGSQWIFIVGTEAPLSSRTVVVVFTFSVISWRTLRTDFTVEARG